MTPIAKALQYCKSVTVLPYPPDGGSAFTAEAVMVMPDGREDTLRAAGHDDPDDAIMEALIRAILAYHGEDRRAVNGEPPDPAV